MFRLPVRATEGLLRSVRGLMGLVLAGPADTTRSRRQQTLQVVIPRYTPSQPLPGVGDSTGLKVYGEGEWKVRVHGGERRRPWRKLHLGGDEASREIVAPLWTTAKVNDSRAFPALWEQSQDPVEQVSADGAFDTHQGSVAGAARGARAAIPRGRMPARRPPSRGAPANDGATRRWRRSRRTGGRSGNPEAAIIAAAWPRTPSTVSSGCSVIACRPVISIVRITKCIFAAPPSIA